MLRTVSDLKGCSIGATDGAIGEIDEVYFDDQYWTIRYLVVDTSGWLAGRRVLISPRAVRGVDLPNKTIAVTLSREQVESGPSVDADRPVDRRYEMEYSRYYGYPYYWTGPYRWGATPYPGEAAIAMPEVASAMPPTGGDPSLRSTRNVTGYYIEATDGDIGHVDDFIVDTAAWAIRYMLIDTRNWWPGKKVLVSTEWISRVSWPDSRVYVDMSKEAIKGAPEYDPDRPLARDYETRLFGHHHRTAYWD